MVLGPSYSGWGYGRGAIVSRRGLSRRSRKQEAHAAHRHRRPERVVEPPDERSGLPGGWRYGRNGPRLLDRAGARYAARIPAWSSWTSSCHRWVALPSSPPSTTPCPAPGSSSWSERPGRRPCRLRMPPGRSASSRRTDRFNTSLRIWAGRARGRPLPPGLHPAGGPRRRQRQRRSVHDRRRVTAGPSRVHLLASLRPVAAGA